MREAVEGLNAPPGWGAATRSSARDWLRLDGAEWFVAVWRAAVMKSEVEDEA